MNSLNQGRILTLLVVLSCTSQPCSGFFIENVVSHGADAIGGVIWEFIKLIIEGPTGLVIRALTYDYFGIGDAMWDGGWWLTGQGVKKISTVGNALLWSATVKVADGFWNAIKWVFSSAVKGVKYTANLVKGTAGISTALDKLGKVTTETGTITSTDKPDGVVISRRSADFSRNVSLSEPNSLAAILEEAFLTASHYDQHVCLPLVLCTIFADNPYLRTAQENKLASSFRLLQDVNPPPSWAELHLQGVQLGIEATENKKNKNICRDAFPKCPYPVPMLRKLISFAFKNDGLKTFISEDQGYF